MSERGKAARAAFEKGYNCAQSLAVAYCDMLEMDESSAAKLMSGFGGGMGRMREVCGAVSGMIFTAGYLFGYDSPDAKEEKKQTYSTVQELAGRFKERFGSIICRELLGEEGRSSSPVPSERTAQYYRKRPCADLVEAAAEILEEYIESKEVKKP